MKCEIVTVLKKSGYESVYIGQDRSEARQKYRELCNREEMSNKGILGVWHHSTPAARSISKAGHIQRAEEKKAKNAPKPKAKKPGRKPKSEE